MQDTNLHFPQPVPVQVPVEHVPSHERSKRRRNNTLYRVLLVIVALAPLPLGSNRPFFWAIWGGVIGLLAVLYATRQLQTRASLRSTLLDISAQAWLFLILCLYLVVQVLPIAGLIGVDTVVANALGEVTSSTISVAPSATLLMLLRMVTYGVFFYLVLQVTRSDNRRARLFDALLWIVTGHAIIGLVSLQAGDTILTIEKWAYLGSATGTFVNRNSFATFLAFGSTIAATLVVATLTREQPGRGRRLPLSQLAIYGTCYLVIVSTVIATQSRMGLFVTVAGTISPVVLELLRRNSNRVLSLSILGLALAGLGVALTLYGSQLFERVGNIEGSTAIRTGLYEQILDLIRLRPWTGFGGGTFESAFPLVHQLPVNPDLTWDRAHNTYLGLWSELGVVFGSIPILIYLLTAVRLLVALIRREGSWSAPALALSVMLVGGLHSLVDFSLEIQANTFMFLVVTAAGLASTLRTVRGDARV